MLIPRCDGETYDHERDGKRLYCQRNAVMATMKDGEWRTLAAIAKATNSPEASVSARLRDLRKAKFGGHKVERRYVANGLFEYRLIVAAIYAEAA